LRTLQGHVANVNNVAFSPDGKLLASASTDNTIRLWNVSDGTLLHILQGHTRIVYGVAFSPDGQTLASASGVGEGKILLWRMADGALLQTLLTEPDPPTFSHLGTVMHALSFSPDGQFLASGKTNGTIRLWSIKEEE
jgi:WD40 repeat protein